MLLLLLLVLVLVIVGVIVTNDIYVAATVDNSGFMNGLDTFMPPANKEIRVDEVYVREASSSQAPEVAWSRLKRRRSKIIFGAKSQNPVHAYFYSQLLSLPLNRGGKHVTVKMATSIPRQLCFAVLYPLLLLFIF